MTNDEYLTPAEAAEILKVCPRTIKRWIEAGKLPAKIISKKIVRIKREDLDKIGQAEKE